MKNIIRVLTAMAVCASFFARQAEADVVFEEITSQSGMPMGGGGNKTKVLISGDKYRAQKKMNIDAGSMADSMKMSQQMGGVNMKMMNQIQRGGKPDYPDHIMTLDEWAEFDENKQLIDEVIKNKKKGKGLLGKLKKDFKADFGKKKEPEKTLEDILAKYRQELDAGILAKKQDEAADQIAAGGGMGMMGLAQVTDYDTWLRAMIIRGGCDGPRPDEERGGGDNLPPSLRGGKNRKAVSSIGIDCGDNAYTTMSKISDDKTPEYAELKRQYELKSEYKAQYARNRENAKKMPGKMDSMMKEGMAGVAEAAGDMMLNVQIVRLDTGKVIELFPPKGKDPKPEDVTYKEEPLGMLRDKLEDMEEKKQKAMKGNAGNMKEAEAKMAAARAKYGDAAVDQATGGKPQAKKIGNETVNGIACEHWQVKGMSGVDDYWVSNKFPGAEEILAFDAKLKEQIGTGRSGLSFGGGGAPDMGAMMGGTNPAMDAEVARIKTRGIVIKHVNTQKNAAPSQGSMMANQKVMAGDMGAHGAGQMAAMKGMDMSAMAKNPAAMQQMLANMGKDSGAAAQASAEKHQAAGDFKTGDQQDLVNTFELKILNTNPVPAAAFEPPAGARKK